MNLPVIKADLNLLRQNAACVLDACRAHGVQLAAVTKVFCAEKPIVDTLMDAGVEMLADARIGNLERLPASLPRLSLRIADPAQAEALVQCCEYSLQSSFEAVRALGKAARKLKRVHKVILMIDLGDLREGLYYDNIGQILDLAGVSLAEPGLELAGIGCNLTCFGGILPDERNMAALLNIASRIRAQFGIPLPIVSGGNSSSLHLLFQGRMPRGINHLRIGEGLLLGMDTSVGKPFPQLSQDVFQLQARLVEVLDKPSKPEGSTGPNAFGEEVSFPDRGPMRRGILAIGRQDTVPDSLTPLDEGVEILGASSDHLLVNLTHARPLQVGDQLRFRPGYGALLQAYTSPYVTKSYRSEA